MRLSYEELAAEQERWYPIILWMHRNRVVHAAKKTSLILSTIVQWAGWTDDEHYDEVMRRFKAYQVAKKNRVSNTAG